MMDKKCSKSTKKVTTKVLTPKGGKSTAQGGKMSGTPKEKANWKGSNSTAKPRKA